MPDIRVSDKYSWCVLLAAHVRVCSAQWQNLWMKNPSCLCSKCHHNMSQKAFSTKGNRILPYSTYPVHADRYDCVSPCLILCVLGLDWVTGQRSVCNFLLPAWTMTWKATSNSSRNYQRPIDSCFSESRISSSAVGQSHVIPASTMRKDETSAQCSAQSRLLFYVS